MRTRTQGFTLIELLVVIAIIAILAAILMPVFFQVRESARRTKCVANLKQIATTTIMYSDEFNGFLPPFGAPGTIGADGSCIWLREVHSPYLKNDLIFRCPSDNGHPSYPDTARIGFYGARGTSYLFNANIYFVALPQNTPKSIQRCKRPADLILFWDWVSHPIQNVWYQNTAFSDGHVRPLTYDLLADGVNNVTVTLF